MRGRPMLRCRIAALRCNTRGASQWPPTAAITFASPASLRIEP
jgi:hypothetical protein